MKRCLALELLARKEARMGQENPFFPPLLLLDGNISAGVLLICLLVKF